MTAPVHLLDVLDVAAVDAPAPEMVAVQHMEVGGEFEMGIFQHPNSTIRFSVAVPAGGRLRFGQGVKTAAWRRLRDRIRFRVGVECNRRVRWVHRRTLDPRHDEADRAWCYDDVVLPAGTTAIVLETTARQGRTAHAWAGWADPVLEPAEEHAPAPRRRRSAPLVLLISSDACRADSLGVYGSTAGLTPNLDALAADGVTFTGARTSSTTTVGAYATVLTGRLPVRHGMLAEWGTFPAEHPTLVSSLAQAGYRTVFAASEHEIAAPEQGFARLFDDVVPCLGRPSQDGEVTTRRFLRWLDDAADVPRFAWVGFFDTHPPIRLHSSVVAPHYDGDPHDPDRAWRTELIASMRGVESLLELDHALPLLAAGRVPADAYFRLRDTARALAGELESGPDLAAHLSALGAAEPDDVRWLRRAADQLGTGVVDPGLVPWIERLRPALVEIEREIVGHLDGVVDTRYAFAQADAAIAHVDRQIGSIVRWLHETGVYDRSTVLFLSPHGELYGEGGDFGHHQSPFEPVLRTPVVLKPADGVPVRTGPVAGPFESVDVLPTMLDLAGVAPPEDLDGVSAVAALEGGQPLPDRDCIAVDGNAVRVALYRPPHKLVYCRSWEAVDGALRPPGSSRLYRVDGAAEIPEDDATTQRALEASVRTWIAAMGLAPTLP